MSDADNVGIETKKAEGAGLGFCSKFQPQLAPRAVGAGKTLIDYKIYYFPCMGDKCADSWCYEHGMCRHACEHLETFHPEEEGEAEGEGEEEEINNKNLEDADSLVDKP